MSPLAEPPELGAGLSADQRISLTHARLSEARMAHSAGDRDRARFLLHQADAAVRVLRSGPDMACDRAFLRVESLARSVEIAWKHLRPDVSRRRLV